MSCELKSHVLDIFFDLKAKATTKKMIITIENSLN